MRQVVTLGPMDTPKRRHLRPRNGVPYILKPIKVRTTLMKLAARHRPWAAGSPGRGLPQRALVGGWERLSANSPGQPLFDTERPGSMADMLEEFPGQPMLYVAEKTRVVWDITA